MTENPARTAFYAPVAQANIADRMYLNSSAIQSHALNEKEIARQRELFVRTPVMDGLADRLKAHGVIALVGPKGSGRRITAINLLAEIGLKPREVPLDEEDAGELLGPPDMGYIVYADDLANKPKPLRDCISSARKRGLLVFIRVTPDVWRRIAVDGVQEISVTPAPALRIFDRHLACTFGDAKARDWSDSPGIVDCLRSAGPRDAVRLAGLAEEAMAKAHGLQELPVHEVLQAYKNWEEELEHIFSAQSDDEHREGRNRALRLAAAILEGSSPASVFVAARELSSLLDLDAEAGHGLVGPSTRKRLEDISARCDDGPVVFSRTAFASATLDFVWTHWPQLHDDLRQWFRQVAQKLPGDGSLIADRVADLAIRQRHFGMVHSLATGYLDDSGTFDLGVALVTRVAMSDELGRTARRLLYDWSRDTPSRHSAVVVACSGPLAEAFPRMALTRLKHVAITNDPGIQRKLVDALTDLAGKPQLRRDVLDELVQWLNPDAPEQRRAVAAEALLSILRLCEPDDGRLLMVADSDPGWRQVLSAAWRALLKSPASEKDVVTGVGQWLETAAQADAPVSTVVAVLGSVPRSAIDESVLFRAIYAWVRETPGEAVVSRETIFKEVIDSIVAGSGSATRESMSVALMMENGADD
ncbi:hypothetical protein [Nonomuraea endophytica]|uniref:Uncharacterized protein n=1 Tax=Nonomuraea endophytica TaxID=714136 RepID=A0A7W8AA59_9ACTN|nr:hypothetical protein [Nonomuraea endophytica]MBB5081889.1 hypothetical protein [Nonomuraea endophytica]